MNTPPTGIPISESPTDRLERAELRVAELTEALARQRTIFTRTDAERSEVAKSLHAEQLHHLEHHRRSDETNRRMHELSISNRDLDDDNARLRGSLRVVLSTAKRFLSASDAIGRLRTIAATADQALKPTTDNPEGPQG